MKKKRTKAPSATAPKRPTIAELEAILNSEEDAPFEILPNGEVRAVSPEQMAARPKPITMRENLGGEYGKRSA